MRVSRLRRFPRNASRAPRAPIIGGPFTAAVPMLTQHRLRPKIRSRMRCAQRDEDSDSVLGRALTVLGAFTREDVDGVRLVDLARRTNLPKATTHRIVATLLKRGYLERKGPYHRLGVRVFELGSIVSHHRQLRDAATGFMGDLYEATHDTIHLAVRDGCDVVYIEKIGGHRPVAIPSAVGQRMPLYCTALGKVLLAAGSEELVEETILRGLDRKTARTIATRDGLWGELADVKVTGIAYDREEAALGLCCAAAPVFDARRRVVAALSVSFSSRRATNIAQVAAAVRTAAQGVSSALGAPPTSRISAADN
jgi:IclR family acetate operon transcriptional repressor